MSEKLITLYNHYIYERSSDLIRSKPLSDWDYYDLSKIFEYYTCNRLTERNGRPFYEYDDINPSFKEDNRMSKQDTGIDACDLDQSIVQCKLRTNNLSLKECSTFLASQVIMCRDTKRPIIRWENMMLSRNSESKLSEHLQFSKDEERFQDITFETKEVLNYCQSLLDNPPKYDSGECDFIELRDYQKEAIDVIKKNENSIICIPTGCGKNVIIIHSMLEKKKYLILVPRIILMEQLKEEIIRLRPNFKNKIQCVGDSSKMEGVKKDIVICVYNSIGLVNIPFDNFEKIYIDEAHHINLPEIYYDVDDDIDDNVDIDDNDDIDDNVDCEDESGDDDENDDDETNKESYIEKIAKLKQYKNNVYLSATIDDVDGFANYKKEIREMIELGYISDYQIHIPIFNDDPDDKAVCKHLIQSYRNIIVYCSSQNEGKRINELMNQLMKGCSEYIDCDTNKKKRKDIIKKYKEGKIPFLVNVRILVEGFDAPITKGICFIHLPSNLITIIQIIGRALRKHSDKTFANIILPFSKDEDENSISQFLKIMSLNDRRIKKSFHEKTLGGYISIENINENEESENENELELKYNLIFNNMGECLNGVEVWELKLEKVKKYMDENDKRPSSKHMKKEIKASGIWITKQIGNYKNKSGTIMSKEEVCKKWEEFINDPKYSKHFLSDEESWNERLKEVKKYMDENDKRPSCSDVNKEIKQLGEWITRQIGNYKNRSGTMSNEEIYKKWEEFINDPKYSKHILSDEESWNERLKEAKKYMDENDKRPSRKHVNKEIKASGIWITRQIGNYKNRSGTMSKEEFRKKWEEFINDPKYSKFFK